MIVIDEVHCIRQSASFRPEFGVMVSFLGRLLAMMPQPCPRLLLSATIKPADIDECIHVFCGMRTNVRDEPLDRRRIMFKLVISGDAATGPDAQQLWYTHYWTKADTTLSNTADILLEENRLLNGGPDSVSRSFFGTDGIMMKTTTMDAIKIYDVLEDEGTVLDPSSRHSIIRNATANQSSDNTPIALIKIQVILAAKSAGAGISGKFLKYGKVNGFASSFYELVQQLGRLNCNGAARPGSNVYKIHVDFYSYVSLHVRIMQQKVVTRRKLELDQLDGVISLLIVPRYCYHTIIEAYFEWVQREKTHCVDFCSSCLGEMQHFTKRIDKTGLVSLMSTKLRGSNGKLSVSDFVKIMKSNKELIFHQDDVPK